MVCIEYRIAFGTVIDVRLEVFSENERLTKSKRDWVNCELCAGPVADLISVSPSTSTFL